MKFENLIPEGYATLPEADRVKLLRYHLRAALGLSDDLNLLIVGIHIDQAICLLNERGKPAPSNDDLDRDMA